MDKMLVNYIVGERTGEIFGQSRYQKMIYELLKSKVQFNIISYRGLKFPLLSLMPKHLLYPDIVKRKIRDGLVHISSHEQAHILNYLREEYSVVTVFDIFPTYILKNKLTKEYGWLNYLLHKLEVPIWTNALTKAQSLITISEFTKKEVVENLHFPRERIYAIHLGVDTDRYYPIRKLERPPALGGKVIMYAGSEEFRKNIPTLIKAFYRLKKRLPDVKMMKVGRPGSRSGRKFMLKLLDNLRLRGDVTFIDYVPEDKLPIFYNYADLFVFPSVYEGFGLPPLEAMACGVPVITSNAASLPEVVGDAGIMRDPYDVDGFADAMYKVLTDDGLKSDMIEKGLKRASLFSWKKTAEKTIGVYKKVYGQSKF